MIQNLKKERNLNEKLRIHFPQLPSDLLEVLP